MPSEREAHLQGWDTGWGAAMRFVPAEARAEADAYREVLRDLAAESA